MNERKKEEGKRIKYFFISFLLTYLAKKYKTGEAWLDDFFEELSPTSISMLLSQLIFLFISIHY